MDPRDMEDKALCTQSLNGTEELMGRFEEDTPEYEKASNALSELQELMAMLE